MNKPLPIEVTWEPDKDELDYIEARNYDALIENASEINILEKYFSERHDYMQELAEDAYFLFISNYARWKNDSAFKGNLFVESVISVIPHVSDRLYDKREIVRSLIKEVCSRVSKMIWANRKARERHRKLYPPKRLSYTERKTRFEERKKQATDVLLHGTAHGEFYLTGIQAKCLPRIWHRRRIVKRWPVQEFISMPDQLGNIVAQVDFEIRRRSHLLAFGYYPES